MSDLAAASAAQQGKVKLQFSMSPEGAISVSGGNEKYSFFSMDEKFTDGMVKLWSHEPTMKLFANGVMDAERTTARVNNWAHRFRSNNPFGGFVITSKKTDEVIGHFVAGGANRRHENGTLYRDEDGKAVAGPGVSEVAFIVHADFQGQGVGSFIAAMFREWIPYLARYNVSGGQLKAFEATCHPANEASAHVLESMGLRSTKEVIHTNWGDRHYWRLDVEDRVNTYLELVGDKEVTEAGSEQKVGGKASDPSQEAEPASSEAAVVSEEGAQQESDPHSVTDQVSKESVDGAEEGAQEAQVSAPAQEKQRDVETDRDSPVDPEWNTGQEGGLFDEASSDYAW